MRLIRPVGFIAAAILLNGCRLIHGGATDCHKPQEYQRAVQRAPLKVPEGLDSPNTQGALVIPTVELAPPPPGPHESVPGYPAALQARTCQQGGYSGAV